MFLNLSVLFTGGGSLSGGGLCQGDPPYSNERRYTSYSNAFLFLIVITHRILERCGNSISCVSTWVLSSKFPGRCDTVLIYSVGCHGYEEKEREIQT